MYDLANDMDEQPDMSPDAPGIDSGSGAVPEDRKKLVHEITQKIKDDKQHHKKAFDRMRRDMHVAMWGAEENWGEQNYRANIVGRHVKMKTAALYAKNPKTVARRKETMDFAVWDEDPASLQLAMQTSALAQQAVAAAAQQPPIVDPISGLQMPAQPMMPPGLEQAMATLQDFQQGTQRRQMIAKFGKTLEILFAYFMKEQQPLEFKRGMKQVVRRANTAGVGYVELGFQREMGPRPGIEEQLADARSRLDHLRVLAEEIADGDINEGDAEIEELELSIKDLQNQPEVIMREGLIFDYPQATKVIPDKMTKQLDGFIGARHVSIEYTYTVQEVKELFDVDVGDQYTSYTMSAGSQRQISANDVMDEDYEWSDPTKKKNGLVCVWKHYDKKSGLVYYVADGYHDFLREPAGPDVFVEGFWPVFALTFNAVESEKELFPPSDVSLLLDMQREYNRSRQGMREHRHAARPRWVYANGAFEEEDAFMLHNMKPFEALGMNIDAQAKIGDLLQTVPVPGVDPNLYETGQLFSDMQLVGGAQEAQYGGTSQATATESAIAAGATNASDASSIEDLDSFLTAVARAAGQILKREMSEEKVREIVGPGAVWPDMSLQDIAEEVILEVEAGSTGKPNQAIEVANMQRMLPLLMQIPNINPIWLAKEVIRRLDDRLDVAEAIAAGIPSIAAMNQQTQVAAGPPQEDPNQQGPEGASNAPQPDRPGGTSAAFGSNQTQPTPEMAA